MELEETVENTEEVDTQETDAQVEEQETNAVDSEKVIEKLQKRIGKEQAEKNETKTQLDQALSRIEELEKGSKKSVKEKSDEEKAIEAQKAKDDEIAALRAQIKVADLTQQADEVLKESGLAVGKDVLSIIVNEDEETTYSNVKAIINFLNEQQKQWEIKRNTGDTPKQVPKGKTSVDQQQFDSMTFAEKSKLATNDPEQFKKLTGGY
ncbi:capsid assembly scaffolding protein Gp46 family protein [Enterococcus alishanensis]